MPSEFFFGLEIDHQTDGSTANWTEIIKSEEIKPLNNIHQALQNNDISIGPSGNQFFLGRSLITISSFGYQNIADSLRYYSFSNTESLKQFIVSTSFADSLDNPYADMDKIEVQHKFSSVENRDQLNQQGDVFIADTAQFISEFRYRINKFQKPQIGADNKSIFYLKNRQTREVVVDSSGKVVDDFLYASTLELRHLSLESREEQILHTFQNTSSNEDIPNYTVSKDQKYVAYEEHGDIFLLEIGHGKSSRIISGIDPQFSPADNSLLIPQKINYGLYNNENKAVIYRIDDQELTEISDSSGVNFPAWGPDGKNIYYSDRQNLYQYNISSKDAANILLLENYHQSVDGQNTISHTNLIRPISANNKLLILGLSESYYSSESPC